MDDTVNPEEIAGHWWVAGRPRRRVAGTLMFDGVTFPELDLMGTLTEDRASINGAVVLGISNE